MKAFRVKSKYVGFDEDESMVITAKTAEKALEIAKDNWVFRDGKNENQKEFLVVELDLSIEQIIEVVHYGD